MYNPMYNRRELHALHSHYSEQSMAHDMRTGEEETEVIMSGESRLRGHAAAWVAGGMPSVLDSR